VQRQHGGTLSRLVCDPGISLLDNSTTIRDVNIVFYCPKFTFGRLRSGCMEEWSSEELDEFMQLMIVRLIRGNQVDTSICTLQTSGMSRRCFMSYRLGWDPGNFTFYEVLVSRDFGDMLGDCLDCAWMIVVDQGC
jgi:hypothetical protein